MKIKILGCRFEKYEAHPGSEGVTTVAVIVGDLTADLAEDLGCRGLCYTEKGVMREFEGDIGLTLEHSAAEVKLGSETVFKADKLTKYKVFREERAGEGGTTMQVKFRAHFQNTDEGFRLLTFLHGANKKQFACVVDPAQQELPGMEKAS